MWKRIEIDEKMFFIECKIVKKLVKVILYDLRQSWCECVELSKVMERAKELNKRIQFDDITIKATLIAGVADHAQFEENEGEENRTLKLKYRIHTRPFHFKWQLKEQTELEFREAFTIPLFMAVHGMSQQIEELRDVISKKDAELKQYKDEGATLRRTTVATQPFDSAQFEIKFADINKVTKGFQIVAENIMDQFKTEKTNESEELKETNSIDAIKEQPNKQPEISQKEKIKASPRAKKRKNIDFQQKRMEMKVNARKQKLEYESSQSLTESSPDLDVISQELVAIQNSLRDLEKQRIADLNNRSE